MMNTMTYEEAYDLYRKMWEKKLAKGNRPKPSTSSTSDNAKRWTVQHEHYC